MDDLEKIDSDLLSIFFYEVEDLLKIYLKFFVEGIKNYVLAFVKFKFVLFSHLYANKGNLWAMINVNISNECSCSNI